MFILVPYEVDVPQDRWPVANWLIILATIFVFVLQVPDLAEAYGERNPLMLGLSHLLPDIGTAGITSSLMLTGWGLKGLFGHMWLHAGFFHLFGNMLFLWLFGNAVCAKIGNLRYLLLYVLLGMTAGAAHVMFSGGNALGASGAVNGIVGMYLVLFYENEITCLFAFWFIFPYVRTFSVSSVWMILLWLLWDTLGAIGGNGAHVAYFAHLGGFASGFGITLLMCYKGWIIMERYEESLLQAWRRWRHPEQIDTRAAAYAGLGLPASTAEECPPPEVPDLKPIPLPEVEPSPARHVLSTNRAIRTVCACGKDVIVPQQYVGKTIRCSACGQHVVIPQESNFFGPAAAHATTPAKHTPSIRFTCTCGKTIKAPARYAGRVGKCPQCGSRIKIPPASV
jgi:membrane associated rhomboid family serine protease